MKSRNRFLIAFATAAITFSALMLTLGPRRYEHRKWQHCQREKMMESAEIKPQQ